MIVRLQEQVLRVSSACERSRVAEVAVADLEAEQANVHKRVSATLRCPWRIRIA